MTNNKDIDSAKVILEQFQDGDRLSKAQWGALKDYVKRFEAENEQLKKIISDYCKPWECELRKKIIDAEQLETVIEQLKEELDLYTKPCPECKGEGGTGEYHVPCRNCSSTGCVRQYPLPDWFGELLAADYGYDIKGIIPIECRNNKFNRCFTLTRIPGTELWEIEEGAIESEATE